MADVKHNVFLFFDANLLFSNWLRQGRQIIKGKVDLFIILFIAFRCHNFVIVVTCCFKKLLVDKIWHFRWLCLLNSRIQLACATAFRHSCWGHWGRTFLWRARYMIFNISSLLINFLYYQSSLSSFAFQVKQVDGILFLVFDIFPFGWDPPLKIIFSLMNSLGTDLLLSFQTIQVSIFQVFMISECVLSHPKYLMIVFTL